MQLSSCGRSSARRGAARRTKGDPKRLIAVACVSALLTLRRLNVGWTLAIPVSRRSTVALLGIFGADGALGTRDAVAFENRVAEVKGPILQQRMFIA